ncbi:unnamed protein product [Clonostachys rosea f. rosea IK726]|uniref:FAD-binding domain-containing protein n=2 Tax=Bionectria ochroleuca TaxID=29856 RepID=A0A0B7JXA6_BIOOC|nr:unnamed protein product [Clonostachys rosea f. rosea IK726]
MTSVETTDVLVCGCGPTGAMLSVLLGRHGVQNIVLERDLEVNVDPRGIALDEDGVRYLQACGIYDKIFSEIGQCVGNFRFVGGVHNDLQRKPFMVMNYNTTEGGTGHPGFICHKQPVIETNLRSRLVAEPTSDVRLGSTVTSIREDEQWVYVTYQDAAGQEKHIRSRFVVGADGKTGFVRKKYLEPRGIRLETVSQMPYEETWVALNWRISLPTPRTHPRFPLWQKGYTPEQVYDAFFPSEFRFLCNPNRPAVCGRFGTSEDRLWRFEFVIRPDEDGDTMASPQKIREVVFPYITHPGSTYGLDISAIHYPDDCIEVLRSRPFKFSARSCNRWSQDRVILCGDAAHVFPPFGGQGIASGFRDAIGLAWRLAIATRQPSSTETPNYHKLLEGWYTERKQQLDRSLASTVENGSYVTEGNWLKIFVRDWYLWLIQLVPSWKHQLEQGNRRDGMVRYSYQPNKGMAFLAHLGGGINFPQVYCTKLSRNNAADPIQFTDDIIFEKKKKGLFQLVVLLKSADEVADAQEILRSRDANSPGLLRIDEATFIINTTRTYSNQDFRDKTVLHRLATGGEFAADTSLCKGRPKPQYYDPYRMSREVSGKPFVILRPDRFVFAACSTKAELSEALAALDLLSMGNL